MKYRKFILIGMVIILCGMSKLSFASVKDLRILIDVSSSMLDNDPDNLRASALRMLARILPEGTNAGAWIFESRTQQLIPMGIVNSRWIEDVNEATKDIHSTGQFTNIAEAIESASVGWTEPDYDKKRNLILLTDGLVDISEDTLDNNESKAHILNTLLPKLKKLGVSIHCIALSAEADTQLLQKISLTTDGSFVIADNAKDLQNTFLNIFEQTVMPDSIPIKENKFKTDKQAEEITILIFREHLVGNQKRKDISLRSPSGKSYEKQNLPDTIRWYEEGLVDLVTIDKPEIGEWTILGNIDEKNRVFVVSDLKIETNQLPRNLFVGEKVILQAKVMENNKLVSNPDLLQFIDISVEINPATKTAQLFSLRDNGKVRDERSNDGIYSVEIGPLKEQTTSEIIVQTTAKGKTFKRQKQQVIKLLPIPLTLIPTTHVDKEKNKIVEIELIPHDEVIQTDVLSISATIQDNQNRIINYNIPKTNDNSWKLSLVPQEDISQYKAHFNIYTKTLAGRNIALHTRPFVFMVPTVVLPKPKPPEPVVKQLEEEIIIAKPSAPKIPKKVIPPPVVKQPVKTEDNLSIGKVITLVVAFIFLNALFWGMVFIIFKLLRRQREHDVKSMTMGII